MLQFGGILKFIDLFVFYVFLSTRSSRSLKNLGLDADVLFTRPLGGAYSVDSQELVDFQLHVW